MKTRDAKNTLGKLTKKDVNFEILTEWKRCSGNYNGNQPKMYHPYTHTIHKLDQVLLVKNRELNRVQKRVLEGLVDRVNSLEYKSSALKQYTCITVFDGKKHLASMHDSSEWSKRLFREGEEFLK